MDTGQEGALPSLGLGPGLRADLKAETAAHSCTPGPVGCGLPSSGARALPAQSPPATDGTCSTGHERAGCRKARQRHLVPSLGARMGGARRTQDECPLQVPPALTLSRKLPNP